VDGGGHRQALIGVSAFGRLLAPHSLLVEFQTLIGL
jgi:hypothetical protein